MSRSDTAVGWSQDTRNRGLHSSRLGETYDPKSHGDQRLQFRVLSVCSRAVTKEMPMTDIFGLLENDNINGKFDPDDPRKMNIILDLFLEKKERLAMEDAISKYVFTAYWLKSFKELKIYKETNGHFRDLNKTLGNWVSKQRLKKSELNQQKICLLDSIVFTWTIWENGFAEIKEYKAMHGDCLVPRPSHKELFKWVSNQRLQYKYFQEGKNSELNQHRIDLLDGIEFTWIIHVTWDERFAEIKEYKATHGDYRVPRDSHKQLRAWVDKQKFDYKKIQEGKKSALNQDRIDLLDGIEFVWNSHK